jgi:acetyl esterase/lipase
MQHTRLTGEKDKQRPEALMLAVEIQDYARRLMESQGMKAIADAAQKAHAFEEQGQDEQASTWRRIELALREMSGPRSK